ncbi:CLUMA_CG004893, isoform A [Clunio marinus]|uniref:CLUMA_CG004893, isoform A n=1 Tax=Clunio marinus TaxID=568069 RepID=A0A1J1HUI6_9DIPT|nr:CLUMA_CG004893, isoform A [Clunio marinus]
MNSSFNRQLKICCAKFIVNIAKSNRKVHNNKQTQPNNVALTVKFLYKSQEIKLDGMTLK